MFKVLQISVLALLGVASATDVSLLQWLLAWQVHRASARYASDPVSLGNRSILGAVPHGWQRWTVLGTLCLKEFASSARCVWVRRRLAPILCLSHQPRISLVKKRCRSLEPLLIFGYTQGSGCVWAKSGFDGWKVQLQLLCWLFLQSDPNRQRFVTESCLASFFGYQGACEACQTAGMKPWILLDCQFSKHSGLSGLLCVSFFWLPFQGRLAVLWIQMPHLFS